MRISLSQLFWMGIAALIASAVFFIGMAFAFFYFSYTINSARTLSDNNMLGEKTIEITEGASLKEISKLLEEEGVIRSDLAFMLYVRTKNAEHKLQAGVYKVSSSQKTYEIADTIIRGNVFSDTITLTIPEGFTVAQIDERIVSIQPSMAGVSSVHAGTMKAAFPFLSDVSETANLEGYLFPDTYFFKKGVSSNDMAERMLSRFNDKLTPGLRNEIASQDKTLFEIVTMASLIEKEVRTPEDKQVVSGLLWKRIEAGMSLQVDATITYVLNKKSVELSLEDLKMDSPYNTYLYRGLPPGPISNPGIESIIAAIRPKESEYWYYLSRPTGETVFSRTLEEHNKAKRLYLQ